MGEQLINALAFCHYAIYFDRGVELGTAGCSACVGNTTPSFLLGHFAEIIVVGVLVETSEEETIEEPFQFIFGTVGDCKAFRYNCQNKKAVDLTPGNRLNLSDVRDPGGRLGSFSCLWQLSAFDT
jgi:hypothetical protein